MSLMLDVFLERTVNGYKYQCGYDNQDDGPVIIYESSLGLVTISYDNITDARREFWKLIRTKGGY